MVGGSIEKTTNELLRRTKSQEVRSVIVSPGTSVSVHSDMKSEGFEDVSLGLNDFVLVDWVFLSFIFI